MPRITGRSLVTHSSCSIFPPCQQIGTKLGFPLGARGGLGTGTSAPSCGAGDSSAPGGGSH